MALNAHCVVIAGALNDTLLVGQLGNLDIAGSGIDRLLSHSVEQREHERCVRHIGCKVIHA